MRELRFEPEDDAPPIVAGLCATLKRAATTPKLARRLAKMKGVIALRSTSDPQSATIRFDRGRISLERGVAKDAGLIISLGLNALGPGATSPKVKGALRHPLLALGAARVLDVKPKPWRDEAEAFWAFAKDAPRMPRSLLVVCTDDGSKQRFGEGEPCYEVHGTAAALASALSGSSVLLEDVLAGRLKVIGTFEHASVVGGRAIAWAMGEGR